MTKIKYSDADINDLLRQKNLKEDELRRLIPQLEQRNGKNSRVTKAAQLKLKTLTLMSEQTTQLLKTLTRPQLYSLGSPLWAKDICCEVIMFVLIVKDLAKNEADRKYITDFIIEKLSMDADEDLKYDLIGLANQLRENY